MSIRIRKGCLIEAFKNNEVEAIAHQSNCFNTMGSGVALAIKQNFPEAYAADCRTVKGDREKLGNLSSCMTDYGPVFNLYGQYTYGKDGSLYTEYEALNEAMRKMARMLNDIDFTGTIGFPKIGCGTAGGDWEYVEALISIHFAKWEVNVYVK